MPPRLTPRWFHSTPYIRSSFERVSAQTTAELRLAPRGFSWRAPGKNLMNASYSFFEDLNIRKIRKDKNKENKRAAGDKKCNAKIININTENRKTGTFFRNVV